LLKGAHALQEVAERKVQPTGLLSMSIRIFIAELHERAAIAGQCCEAVSHPSQAQQCARLD
jgi:hypothetical protein